MCARAVIADGVGICVWRAWPARCPSGLVTIEQESIWEAVRLFILVDNDYLQSLLLNAKKRLNVEGSDSQGDGCKAMDLVMV